MFAMAVAKRVLPISRGSASMVSRSREEAVCRDGSVGGVESRSQDMLLRKTFCRSSPGRSACQARIAANEQKAAAAAKSRLDDARTRRTEADTKRAQADQVEELAGMKKQKRQTKRASNT